VKTSNLILTDLDKPNKISQNTFFLSDWITSENLIKKKIIDKPLKSFKKKSKAYTYVDKIRPEIEKKLAEYICNYHKNKFSKKLIRSMISLWVGQYLQFVYFRWLLIDELLKKNKKFLIQNIEVDKSINDYLDVLDFMDLAFQNDIFNFFHIKKIITFRKSEFKNKIKFKKNRKFYKKNFIPRDPNVNFKLKILSFFDKFIEIIINPLINKNKLFLKEGFSYKNLILLNFKLKQFPYFGSYTFDWFNLRKKFKSKRENIEHTLKSKNLKKNFEKYVCSNILKDAPTIFFKNLNELENLKKKINLNPKVIISSHSHFYNELFKLWSFQRKLENKSKLIIFNHGGNHSKLIPVFDYEKSVSNEFYDWKNSTNKLCGMTKYLNHNIKRKINKKILFVGMENRKYPCRFYPGPLHHDEMNSIKHLAYILKGLNDKGKDNFFYLPNRTILQSHQKILSKYFKREKILNNLSLRKNIKNFSLIICSSPMTAFFDCILSGPTLLLIDKEQWITEKKISLKYDLLRKNKILFYNKKDLLRHLNKIYPDKIYSWWNSNNTQFAINSFLKEFNFVRDDSNYQKKIIKKLMY
tara:strand:- start:1931 stop:3673 length:1743 start_codon:yes stop_codon:yes gene_type:complete